MAVSEAFLASINNGPYLSAWKVLPVLFLLLIWMRLLSWTDKDAPNCRMPREWLNTGNFLGVLLAGFLFFVLPVGFVPALLIFFSVMLIEAGVYLGWRSQTVGLHDLGKEFHDGMQSIFNRKGKDVKEQEAKAGVGEVKVLGKSGAPLEAPDEGPERVQFDAAMAIVTEPIIRDAERIELTIVAEGAEVVYTVDGVPYAGAGMDRPTAAGAVGYLKMAAGLQAAEKRKPQTGNIKVLYGKEKHELKISTKGSAAGENMLLQSDIKKRLGLTLADLGMTPEQFDAVTQMVKDGSGLVLIAAPPGQGLTSLEYAFLRSHDAFLLHLRTVERAPEIDLEGITQLTIPAGAGAADEAKEVALLVSQEPDVALVSLVTDGSAARDLCRFAAGANRRAYAGLRAGSSFDALKIWRKLVADDGLAMKELKMVVAGRLVRKLCEACKIGYAPDPAALKKLNFDPAVVTELFQARTTRMKDNRGHEIPCGFCSDLGYKGRTGIFEVLLVTDEIRTLVLRGAGDQELKTAYRKQKGRYIQEAALDLVQRGSTSLSEVQRVLKAEPPAARPPAGPSPGPSGGGRAAAPRPRA